MLFFFAGVPRTAKALGPSFLAMALRAIGATLLPLSLSRDSRGAAQAEACLNLGAQKTAWYITWHMAWYGIVQYGIE